MKKILGLFLTITFSFIYSQKIGIVSNINPKLGYIHTKAGIKFNPVFENEMDYNLIDFIDSTIFKLDRETQNFDDFDWSKLGYFDQYTHSKPILNYLKSYCESNNIEVLLILRKVNSFNDPMDMFFNFRHNFGIMTFPQHKNRALMYFNFGIYKYSLKDDKIYLANLKRNEKMDVYINKYFDTPIYDDKKLLIDETVPNLILPIFENYIKSTVVKLVNQNEKEVYPFKK